MSRTDWTNTPGFALGGTLALNRWAPLSNLAFIPQLELFFARRNPSGLGETYSMDLLELPLVLRGELTIGNRAFYAFGGMYTSILLRAQKTDSDGIVENADTASRMDAFVHRNANDAPSQDGSLALDYVDASMLLRGEVVVSGRTVYGFGGLYGSVLVRAQRTRDGTITDMRDAISPIDTGWLAGAGFELASAANATLSIELRYQRGFQDVFSAESSEISQQSISCLFGVQYGSRSEPIVPITTEPGPSVLHSGNQKGSKKRTSPSTRVPVTLVREGEKDLRDLSWRRIERGEQDDKFGYNITYDIPGYKTVVFFWPRERIDFDNKSTLSSFRYKKIPQGWLRYPVRITRWSLPTVYDGIQIIEEAYEKDADGAIDALHGFVLIAGIGSAKPTLRATSPRGPPRTSIITSRRVQPRRTSKGAAKPAPAKPSAEKGSVKTRAQIIAANRAAGAAAEKVIAQQRVAEGNTILGSQVSVRTSLGLRRIDHLIQTPAGRILAVEVKSGNSRRNVLQLAKDTTLATEGGVIIGRNAPNALRGQHLIIETIVKTVK